MKKNIAWILKGRDKMITATEKVLQSLPSRDFRFANPFILLHHVGPDVIARGSDNRIHPHPHRGFAPVTFQLQGQAHHKDSMGNDQLLNPGDVQWMFAGKGILHSEGPSEALHTAGGVHELLQLWVNVPAANKWEAPRYQHIRKEALPKILEAAGVDLRLASGQFDGKTGPVEISYTPVITVIGEVRAGKEVEFEVMEGYWTLLYVVHGRVTIDDLTPVGAQHLVVFKREGTMFSVVANEDSQVLFLCAQPIDEPVVAKDNFVMTTPAEIEQAMADYQNGVFGVLKD